MPPSRCCSMYARSGMSAGLLAWSAGCATGPVGMYPSDAPAHAWSWRNADKAAVARWETIGLPRVVTGFGLANSCDFSVARAARSGWSRRAPDRGSQVREW
jgi:hypothetical protein